MPAWAAAHGVELESLHYIAEQRALRAAAMLIDGTDPASFKTGGFRAVKLSPHAKALMPVLMACVFDGFAIGLTVKGDDT